MKISKSTGEVGRPDLTASEWSVRPLDALTAVAMVRRWHYSGGCSRVAIYVHGLYPVGAFWDCEALGAAIWLPPTRGAAERLAGSDWRSVLSLSRLVTAPCAPRAAAFPGER